MVGGETGVVRIEREDLPSGATLTQGGRVSAAKHVTPDPYALPFTPVELSRLDEALTATCRGTGLDFSIYLGALGAEPRVRAERLHSMTSEPAEAVVLAVSPGERVLEIVTGDESSRRLSERACKLAVMTMTASFKEGDLIGGLISGLRTLADQAGQHH